MRTTPNTFRYEESDIPEGLTLREWRRRQGGGPHRRSLWRGSSSLAAAVAASVRRTVHPPRG
jgi:hypothetical protein